MNIGTLGIQSSMALMLAGALAATCLGTRLSSRIYGSLLFIAALTGLLSAILALEAPMAWSWSLPSPISLTVASASFKVDSLSSIFLCALFVISIAIAIYTPDYIEHRKEKIGLRAFWLCLFLFILAMEGVLLASNSPTFLVLFEIMSLSSAVLVGIDFKSAHSAKAALIYLGGTRMATAALCAGFLLMYLQTGDWSFSSWHISDKNALLPLICILVGLAIKAGLWPFHIWLPYAHPQAPSPVSALMSGIMIKIAIYGIVRIFLFGEPAPAVLAIGLLLVSIITALWGIIFAIVQNELKHLLAYSSVENIGLIVSGLAIAIYARSQDWTAISTLATTAALLHVFNHAIVKSLLFLAAGSVDYSLGSLEFAKLGGLSRKMPLTMLCMLIASVSICALPPFNCFSSKWLIYRSIFEVARVCESTIITALAIIIICVFSIVGALSLICFSLAFAMVFLGRGRSRAIEHAHEASSPMLFGMLALASICIICGAASPIISVSLTKILCGEAVAAIPTLPIANLLITIIGITTFISLIRGKNASDSRVYDTWECGFGTLSPRMQITAASLAQPIAVLFKPLLLYRLHTEISGRDPRHFPEKVRAEASSNSLLESRIYGPIIRLIRWSSDHLAKLQAGSIHLYLAYVLLTLIFLLLLGTRQ